MNRLTAREWKKRAVVASAIKRLCAGEELTGVELFGDEWRTEKGGAGWAYKLMSRMVQDRLLSKRKTPGDKYIRYSARPGTLDRFLDPQEISRLIWPSEHPEIFLNDKSVGTTPEPSVEPSPKLRRRVRFGRDPSDAHRTFDATFVYIARGYAPTTKGPPPKNSINVYVRSIDAVDNAHAYIRDKIRDVCKSGRAVEFMESVKDGIDLTDMKTASASEPDQSQGIDRSNHPQTNNEGASDREVLEGILHLASATAENMIYLRDRIDELHGRLDELKKVWE